MVRSAAAHHLLVGRARDALYPKLRDPDETPALPLVELLRRVSRRYRDSSERLVRVIDGLYEVAAKRGSNPLAAFLPLPLPPGVSVLRSSRRDYSHPALFLREPHSATIELDDEKT